MGRGLLGSIFNVLDPVLDTVDPMHNKVQEWTTGSKETEKQSPYFETIAPFIVDLFLPGWGSALGAADGASTGNWTKAGLSALGSYAGFTGAGSSAATGASEGLQATEGLQAADALQATEGLASTGGEASSFMNSSTSFSPAATNDVGMQGLLSSSGSQAGTQFMTMPSSEISSAAGVGGVGQGLGTTAANAVSSAGTQSPSWYSAFNNGNMKGAMKAYGSYEKTVATEQQKKRQEEAMRNAETRQMMNQAMAGMGGDTQRRPVASFAQTSPYASFQGGFNPKRYGANVRQQGLLG